MKITSKFLTAEVRLTRLVLSRQGVRVEGTVKEMMPMAVDISAHDLRCLASLLIREARATLRGALPAKWNPTAMEEGGRPA